MLTSHSLCCCRSVRGRQTEYPVRLGPDLSSVPPLSVHSVPRPPHRTPNSQHSQNNPPWDANNDATALMLSRVSAAGPEAEQHPSSYSCPLPARHSTARLLLLLQPADCPSLPPSPTSLASSVRICLLAEGDTWSGLMLPRLSRCLDNTNASASTIVQGRATSESVFRGPGVVG